MLASDIELNGDESSTHDWIYENDSILASDQLFRFLSHHLNAGDESASLVAEQSRCIEI